MPDSLSEIRRLRPSRRISWPLRGLRSKRLSLAMQLPPYTRDEWKEVASYRDDVENRATYDEKVDLIVARNAAR